MLGISFIFEIFFFFIRVERICRKVREDMWNIIKVDLTLRSQQKRKGKKRKKRITKSFDQK